MVCAHTEYIGNAHTRDGSVYCHAWWHKGGPFYCCCAYYYVYCEFKSTSLMMCEHTEGTVINLHGTDVTCHLIHSETSNVK